MRNFVVYSATAILILPSLFASASEPGTIGVEAYQLYDEQQPTKHGVFLVRRVEPSSAAAETGIQSGDAIIAIDGKSVLGFDSREIKKGLDGEIGSSIELTVIQPNNAEKKFTLVRKPYPPHLNPPTDQFSYIIPGNWKMDPRYPFPLSWFPAIPYKGFEDISFAPGFGDTDSPEYHSVLFLWWLDGRTAISAAELQSDMVAYFTGLAEQRGRNNHFKPDPSRITAQYTASSIGPDQFGGAPATNFTGLLTLYDTHGNVITLHSEVTASQCSSDHTAVFFSISKEPRPAPLWKQFDAVRDSFKCKR